MTNKELINILENYPDDMVVLLTSWEDGYDSISDIKKVNVFKPVNKFTWQGDYLDCEDTLVNKDKKIIKAICIDWR